MILINAILSLITTILSYLILGGMGLIVVIVILAGLIELIDELLFNKED